MLTDGREPGSPGHVWVDVPAWDDAATEQLSQKFGLHPRAVADCGARNPVPKVHVYADHVFVVLHAPERGERGHVHYVEIDQFVGPDFLITVHGPCNPALPDDAKAVETSALLRHGLLAVRTMSTLSQQVYGRMATLEVFGPGSGEALLVDLEDQFGRIAAIADSQREYLQGVIEFYQTRTNTKMTIAAERLAAIAAVTLPVTAISSVMGMNVIVNSETRPVELIILLTGMLIMSIGDLGAAQGLVVITPTGREPPPTGAG